MQDMKIFDLPQAHSTTKPRLDIVNVVYFSLIHIGAIAALFCFTWTNFFTYLGLWTLTGMGITVGFHRMLTHQSFKTWKVVEYMWAILGTLAGQRGPVLWVAHHRQHHLKSDTQLDPHDINKGFMWAHMGWIFNSYPKWYEDGQSATYAPDIMKDPFLRFLDKYDWLVSTALGVALVLIGGWDLFFWGFCLRLTSLYHATWFVNSAAHKWGYRYFKNELATNNWWVALLTFGEGWHNNHHAFPTSARHGLRFWEFDVTWISIWFMGKFGMAKKIRVPKAEELPWKQKKLLQSQQQELRQA